MSKPTRYALITVAVLVGLSAVGLTLHFLIHGLIALHGG
jgi:small-conductance mechanosensitive channel